MRLLAIDPSSDPKKLGWAFFEADRLCSCGLGRPPTMLAGTFVVIEKPQIYSFQSSKADPNDLVTLAVAVGVLAGRYGSLGCDLFLVLPKAWKGTVPKTVHNKRVMAQLTPTDNMLALRQIPKSLHHNVIDAIGLGKWWLKRASTGILPFGGYDPKPLIPGHRDRAAGLP